MSIEQVKMFWNQRPCNIRHSDKQLGTMEYFDEVEKKKYTAEPHILAFADFEKWRDKDVLEIGCGIGTAVVSFARAGARVTAIDISEVSVELCRRRLQLYGLDAEIYVGDAENLNEVIPLHKYDLIYSFGVIHHSPNPQRIIEQITQYIKPQGELRIMLYSLVSYKLFDIMHRENKWNIAQLRSTIQTHSEAEIGCPCTFVYSFEEVRELLEPFFMIDKIWKDHIFTWDIEAYKQGKFIRAHEWSNVSDIELKRLEKELGWHTLIHARPRK